MKYKELYKLLKESGKFQETARKLGISEEELLLKLKGEKPFYLCEFFEICGLHNIKNNEEREKFFYPEYPKSGK